MTINPDTSTGRRTDALRYAIAVLKNHRDVASDDHRPLIQGYLDTLETLLHTLNDRLGVDRLDGDKQPIN